MDQIIVCRVKEMDLYEGPEGSGFQGEAYNFRVHQGRCFGFFAPSGGRALALEKHFRGADQSSALVLGVTVIWAHSVTFDRRLGVAGWYDHANLYRHGQSLPKEIRTPEFYEFRADADCQNCYRVPRHARPLIVPPLGRAKLWYAEDPAGLEFKREFDKMRRDWAREAVP